MSELEKAIETLENSISVDILDGYERIVPVYTSDLKSVIAAAKMLPEMQQAIKPFISGVDIVRWGKIKSLIGVEMAKSLTHHNYNADKVFYKAQELLK